MSPQCTLRLPFAFGLLLAAALAGCSDSTSPGIQPEVTNAIDSFQFQVTDVRNFTNTFSYTWQNSGTSASVDQSTTVTAGAMTLTIRDADGTEVYSKSLAVDGSFVTGAGTPGDWTITVGFNGASGTVNFRVQKRP